MSCESFETLIALHVEGDLTPAETEELERHLRDCAACRGFDDEMRASQRALKKHGRAAVDPAVLAGIRAGVLRRIERRQPVWPGIAVPRPRRFSNRLLALAASLVLVLGAAVLLLLWSEIGRPEPTWQGSEIEPAPPVPIAEPTPTHAPPPAPEPAPPPTPAGPRQAQPRPVEEPETPRIAAQQELPASPRSAVEPMVIKLVSDDLVIYWLVESETNQEETNHEIST